MDFMPFGKEFQLGPYRTRRPLYPYLKVLAVAVISVEVMLPIALS